MARNKLVARLSLLTALVASQMGCAGPLKYEVQSSEIARGADAKIIANVHEKQNQTHLEVEVVNLIPPERVNEATAQYLGWYRTSPEGVWMRIGALEYDPGDRKGKLIGSVPESAFDFEISAEAAGRPGSPSNHVIFAQRVERK